ncbi:MAG: winged helix-turn-helix transcriptional regulator [Actinobacteria bacterium]|nr:winged helix-turn-helix transcriptional regulator [Actinomycetota bacterium]
MTMKAPQGEEMLHGVPGRDDAALAAAAALFRGFGDPSRLAIVCHLALGEHNVRDLTEHLELAQSTVSAHLRCLLDCGMVTVRARGRSSVYALAVDHQILDLLAAAERLLAATGDAVTFCPRYGIPAQP